MSDLYGYGYSSSGARSSLDPVTEMPVLPPELSWKLSKGIGDTGALELWQTERKVWSFLGSSFVTRHKKRLKKISYSYDFGLNKSRIQGDAFDLLRAYDPEAASRKKATKAKVRAKRKHEREYTKELLRNAKERDKARAKARRQKFKDQSEFFNNLRSGF